MKVCERCGCEEDAGMARDGMNLCRACEDADEVPAREGEAEKARRLARNKRAREARRAREAALRSCGLVKVRGALGGTYWE